MANNDVSVEDEELDGFMATLSYYPNTTTKDHRIVTRYEDGILSMQNVSLDFARRIKAFCERREHEAELRGRKDELNHSYVKYGAMSLEEYEERLAEISN